MAKSGVGASKPGPMVWATMFFAAGFLVTIFMAALFLNGVFGMEGFGYFMPVVMVLAVIGSLIYWRTLDEPSKEAHKFAFFWGAGGAFALATVIGFQLVFIVGFRTAVQGWVDGWIALTKGAFGDEPGAVGFYFGVLASTFAMMVGYTLVWAGWWAAQRIGTKSA